MLEQLKIDIITSVKIRCQANGIPIISNNEIEITTDIENDFLSDIVQQALEFAYVKRKGLSNSYDKTKFNQEVKEKYKYIIINMVYTHLTRIGTEGQLSHSENGIVRVYDNSGLYLLDDTKRIVPLGKAFGL